MSNPLRHRRVAAAISVLLILAACGDDSDGALSGNVIKDGLGCSVTTSDRSPDAPEVDLSAVEVDEVPEPDGDVEPDAESEAGNDVEGAGGDGTDGGDVGADQADGEEGGSDEVAPEVDTEDLVTVDDEEVCDVSRRAYVTLDMVGVKASDGTEFVNTFGQERPVNAQRNQGQLLSGIEQGIEGMRVGARRQITIPPDLAYGADGNPEQGIGPDETVVFVVDVVAATDEPGLCNDPRTIPAGREGKPTSVDIPMEPWTELTTSDLVVGDGEVVSRDAYVKMDYLGVGCFSGAQFDSSWDRDEQLSVALGDKESLGGFSSVIDGWTDGIEGMKVGGVRQINIPAELAYGKRGSPPDIGPNEPLVFVVELVEIVPDEDVVSQAEADAAGQVPGGEEPTEGDEAPGATEPEAPETADDADADVSSTTGSTTGSSTTTEG